MRRTEIRAMAVLIVGASAAYAQMPNEAITPERMGVGWEMIHLDKVVDIDTEARRMTVSGAVTVRLDSLDESYGPTLNLNYSHGLLTWDRADAGVGATAEINAVTPESEHARLAHMRFEKALNRGDELTIKFEFHSIAKGPQLGVRDDFAMASWVEAWTPVPLPRVDQGERFRAGMLIAPGTTTLLMPESWVGLSDGELLSRTREDGRTVEVWDVTGVNAARSFVAGPFTIAEREADGRAALVYRLTDAGMSADALATRMAEVIAALESKLGPFPAPSYGIVEAPNDLTDQWYAASQQTFIVAKSSAFDYEHGNTPLWAHESCHAWWGNLIGSQGIGSLMCSEALAQLGVLIALEETEGRDAMDEFLEFSRSGYSSTQCAAGYFYIWRDGGDKPLAQLDDDRWDHHLSDSKGVWFWHMLRDHVGEDVFYGTLRDVIADKAHDTITLDGLRSRFIAASPSTDLESFFAQWLDRSGAPVIDVDWWATNSHGNRGVHLALTQWQPGEPFEVSLDIAIDLQNGERLIETISLTEASQEFEISTGEQRVVGIELDPNRRVLIWRPSYGARPVVDDTTAGMAEAVVEAVELPADVIAAIVGEYQIENLGMRTSFVHDNGVIIAKTTGRPDLPLVYEGEGVFRSAIPSVHIRFEFQLAESPSPSLTMNYEGNQMTARRVKEGGL